MYWIQNYLQFNALSLSLILKISRQLPFKTICILYVYVIVEIFKQIYN